MQVVFVVIDNDDASLRDMKIFDHERDARKYQSKLKNFPEHINVTVYEREVVE